MVSLHLSACCGQTRLVLWFLSSICTSTDILIGKSAEMHSSDLTSIRSRTLFPGGFIYRAAGCDSFGPSVTRFS